MSLIDDLKSLIEDIASTDYGTETGTYMADEDLAEDAIGWIDRARKLLALPPVEETPQNLVAAAQNAIRDIMRTEYMFTWGKLRWSWNMQWGNDTQRYHLRIGSLQYAVDDQFFDFEEDTEEAILDAIYDQVDYHLLHENSIRMVERDASPND